MGTPSTVAGTIANSPPGAVSSASTGPRPTRSAWSVIYAAAFHPSAGPSVVAMSVRIWT